MIMNITAIIYTCTRADILPLLDVYLSLYFCSVRSRMLWLAVGLMVSEWFVFCSQICLNENKYTF